MPIDLRSDTITQPTPAMREVMAWAEVDDDVFGDDPAVARLEARTEESEAAWPAPSFSSLSAEISQNTSTRLLW